MDAAGFVDAVIEERPFMQCVNVRRLGSHPILPFVASGIAVGGHQ